MACSHLMSRLTILGSGTCVPSLERSSCSVLLNTGESSILMDAGPGTIRRLLHTGTGIFDITHIFFSHFHPDHTGELVSFLFASKYPQTHSRRTPLALVAGKGFANFFQGLKNVYGHWIELAPDVINVIELDHAAGASRSCRDFKLDAMPVNHNPESLAYRFTLGQGTSLVYSGDTGYSENLVKLARQADILICECALPDAFGVEGHLTPSLAGKIASLAQVKRLILTHFYPECDRVDIEKECRQTYGGPLVLAKDLMMFDLA